MSTYWKDRLFVAIQFLLMVAYILPLTIGSFQRYYEVGMGLVAIGGLVVIAAIWQLRHAISPFPSPKATANLIDNGVFRWVRHPIYTGILAVSFGYALISGSVWKALVALTLLVLFQFKARYEEQLLKKNFDQYSKYMEKTGRFLPKVGR